MGSCFSFPLKPFLLQKPLSPNPSLGDLPEPCLALILVYLDPPQICRLSKLNRAFRSASSADFVWESKLPTNYDSIIREVFSDFPSKCSLKDIYASLSRYNSFDGDTKKVWMNKSTGRLCLSISWKGLSINGIDDRRYWKPLTSDESRFGTVAYLQQIWWFEVDGEVEFPFPADTYSVFFRLHLGWTTSKRFGRRVCNSDHVHGWDVKPVHFKLSTSDGQNAISKCSFEEPGQWVHFHVGDFMVKSTAKPVKIKFSMTQIDCTHPKGGLCLDSVVICPIQRRDSD